MLKKFSLLCHIFLGGVTFSHPVGGGKGLLPWIQIVITEWKEKNKTKHCCFFFLGKKKNFKFWYPEGDCLIRKLENNLEIQALLRDKRISISLLFLSKYQETPCRPNLRFFHRLKKSVLQLICLNHEASCLRKKHNI